MAILTTDQSNYEDIADAIREKNGTGETYLPSEMAGAIRSIHGDVTGVKGDSESNYRTGNVNLTPANVGAKATQTPVASPSASGTAVEFIDTITQNAQGVITPTKKAVRTATASQSGLMSAADKVNLDNLQTRMPAAENEIGDLADNLYDISGYIDIQSLEWIANSYVKQNGEIAEYNGWHRTDYIDIGNADVVYLYATSDSANARFNCWYDENKTYISDFLCNKYTTEYTPPANARYFILSCESSNDVQHGVKSYSIETARDNLGVKPNRPAYYYRGTLAASATHDTQISIAPKIGFKLGLYAKLSSAFAGLTIQFDAYSPNQIIIDTTNVTLKSRFHEDVVLPHGMSTIADDVTINAVVDNPTSIHVSIASKGVENTVTGTFEITAYETLKIINGNQALSDMVLSVGCASINHDVWVFGDSYMGMTGPYRWGYYLNANGYMKGIMVCASSGSGYNEAARWLTSLMSMGTPRKIVWCMGMNYNDNEWLLQTQELRELCEAKTIELILATIPSVPSKNNEAKNTYVRSSGLRYIDLAASVGAQPDGTWYAGMLASDNVHPSVTGALALYNAAIASVPELTYD